MMALIENITGEKDEKSKMANSAKLSVEDEQHANRKEKRKEEKLSNNILGARFCSNKTLCET